VKSVVQGGVKGVITQCGSKPNTHDGTSVLSSLSCDSPAKKRLEKAGGNESVRKRAGGDGTWVLLFAPAPRHYCIYDLTLGGSAVASPSPRGTATVVHERDWTALAMMTYNLITI